MARASVGVADVGAPPPSRGAGVSEARREEGVGWSAGAGGFGAGTGPTSGGGASARLGDARGGGETTRAEDEALRSLTSRSPRADPIAGGPDPGTGAARSVSGVATGRRAGFSAWRGVSSGRATPPLGREARPRRAAGWGGASAATEGNALAFAVVASRSAAVARSEAAARCARSDRPEARTSCGAGKRSGRGGAGQARDSRRAEPRGGGGAGGAATAIFNLSGLPLQRRVREFSSARTSSFVRSASAARGSEAAEGGGMGST